MEPGFHMIAGCKASNNERLRKAEIRMNPDKKLRRQILRAKKLKKNEKIIEKEGDLYVPGGFGKLLLLFSSFYEKSYFVLKNLTLIIFFSK